MPTQYSRPATEEPRGFQPILKTGCGSSNILFFLFFKSNLYSIRTRIKERYLEIVHIHEILHPIYNNTLHMLLLYFPSGGNSICTKSTVFPSVYTYKYIASAISLSKYPLISLCAYSERLIFEHASMCNAITMYIVTYHICRSPSIRSGVQKNEQVDATCIFLSLILFFF